jgi:hypothetical protein
MAYLYRHIRLDKNQPFYIGIGSNNNYDRAYNKHHRNQYWKRIINKTKYKVDILFDNISWEEACEKEKEFISLYGRVDIGTGILCNMTNGGEGTNGSKRNIESIIRIKKSKSGINNPMYGKKISDIHRKRLSESRIGGKHPRARMY